jgi:hypothetical protein
VSKHGKPLRHLKPQGVDSCRFGSALKLVKLASQGLVVALAHRTGAGLMAACAAKFGGSHQGVAGLAELWRGDGELNLHEGLRWLKKKLKKEAEKKPKAVC